MKGKVSGRSKDIKTKMDEVLWLACGDFNTELYMSVEI